MCCRSGAMLEDGTIESLLGVVFAGIQTMVSQVSGCAL